jgi:phage terminase small subunit
VVAPKKFGGFTTAGIKTTAAPETWPFGTKPPEAVAPAPAAPPTVLSEDMSALTPLDLLLQVMRDPGEDMRTRIQAAQLAAPYLHAKPAAAGKKEERSAAARRTSAVSKFAPATPPKLVVNNQ